MYFHVILLFSDSFPFMVQLRLDNEVTCGGSLITPSHVLSAAHCSIDLKESDISVSFFIVLQTLQ